jgi:hypothetical protein
MSPLNGLVLGGAAVVASPALYAGLVERSMPLDTALTRYLVAVGVCWVLLSLLAELALPSRDAIAKAVAEREKERAEQRDESAGEQTRSTVGRHSGQPPA